MTAAAHDPPYSYASGGGCTAGWIPAGADDGADFFASTSPTPSSSALLDHFTSSSSATTAITAVASATTAITAVASSLLASHYHYDRGDNISVPVAAESTQSGISVQQPVAAFHQNKQATTTTATAMESAALSVSGMTAMMTYGGHQAPAHAAVDDDDMSFFDSLAVTSAAANDDDVGMSSAVPSTASSQQRPAAAAAAGTSIVTTAAAAAAAREEDALNFYHRSDDEHHYVMSNNGGGGGDVFTDYDESSSSNGSRSCPPPAQVADYNAVERSVDEVDVVMASPTYQLPVIDELLASLAARNYSSSSAAAGQDSSKQINSTRSSSSPPLEDETSSNSVRPAAAAAAADSYQQYDDAGLLLGSVGAAGTTITSSMSMTGSGGNMLPSLHHQPENPPSSSQHDSVTTTTQHSPSLLNKDPLIHQVAHPVVAAHDSITTVPAAITTTTTTMVVESTSSSDWETYLWQVAQQQPTLEQQQDLLEQWAVLYGEEYAQYCLQQVQQHLLVLSNYQQQTNTGIDQQYSSHVVQDNQDPASSRMVYSVAEGLQSYNNQQYHDGLGGQVGASVASRQLQQQQQSPLVTNLAAVNETGLMGNAAAAAAIDYGKPMQQQSLYNENYQWTPPSTASTPRQQWDQGNAVSAAAVASESSLLTVYDSTLTSTASAPGSSNYATTSMLHHQQQQQQHPGSSNYATSMLHHQQQQQHYHGTASQQPQLYSSNYNQFHGGYGHPAPDHSMTQPPYNDLMPWPAANPSGASSSTSFTSAAAAAVSNPYGSTPYVMTTAPGSGTAGPVAGFGHNTTSNNSIYEQQQWQQQQLRQVGTTGLPVNAHAARTCPNGRPSCPIVSFGFGGTVVLIRPVTSNEDAATTSQHQPSSSFNLLDAGAAVSPHNVTVTSVPKLLDYCLKALVPVVAASTTGFTHYHDSSGSFATTSAAPGLAVGGMTNRDLTTAAGGGSDLMSIEETVRLLSTYPGPLGPSSSREKILKYIKERCQQQEPSVASTAFNGVHTAFNGVHTATQQEPSHHTSVEHNEVMMRTLWSVLAALVNVPHHHGAAAAAAAAGISSTAAAAIGGAAATALRLLGLGQQKESGTLESELVQALKALTSHQYITLSSAGPAQQSGISATAAAAAAGTMSSWLQPVVGWSGCGPQRQQDLVLRQAPDSNVLAPVLPVEEQLREAAVSVQALLVRGDKLAAFKEAVSASLWGPALLLGSSLGEKYYSQAACALALSGMSPGAPLRTLALIMAGRADLAVQGGTRTAAAAAASPPAGHSGVVATGGGTLDPVLQQWASNLAVLAGHRGLPGVMEAVAALGDRLNVEEGQALASHICYAVAGLSPGFMEIIEATTTKTGAEVTDAGTRPSTASSTSAAAIGPKQGIRYCLLGADACLQPRTYANLLAIQRTEVLEWALRAAGAVAGASTLNRSGSATPTGLGPGGQHSTAAAAAAESWSLLLLPLQPYKLLYAHMLAECGLVSEALTYCQALDSALKMAPGNRVPPGFVVLARELEGLRERLLAFATARSLPMSTASGGADTTAASGNKGETSLNKIGKFLDGTLNKLLWGGSTAQPSQQQQDHTQAAGIPYGGAGYPASGPTSTGPLLTNTSIVSGSTTPTSRVSGGGAGGSAAGVPFVAYGGNMAQHHHLSASAFTPAASSAAGTPHMHMSPSPSNNSLSSYASVPAAGPHLYGAGTMANSYFVPNQAAAVGAHRRFPSSGMPGDSATTAINDPNHSLNPAASLIAVASVAPVQTELDARQSGSGAPESSFAAAAAAGTQSQYPSSFNPYHNVSAPPSSSSVSSATPLPSSATPLTNQPSAALPAPAPVLAAGTEVNTTSSIPSVGGSTAGAGEEAGGRSSGPPSSSNRGSGISSFLGSLFGGRGSVDSGSSTAGQKRDPLDTASEDTIYYDKARGRWVTRGEEDAVEDTPLPPPPTSSSGAAGGAATISAASAAAIAPLTMLPSSSSAAAAGTAVLPPTGIVATSTAAAAAIGARTAKPRGGGVGSRYVDTFSHPPLIPGTAAAAAAVPAPSISLPPRPPPGRFFVPGSQSSSSAAVPNPAEPSHASSSSSPSQSLYHSSAFDTTSANSNLFAHYQGGDGVTSSSYSATAAVVDQHDVRLGQREALTTLSHTTPDHTLENRILDAPSSRRRSGAEEGAPGSTRSEANPGNLQPLRDSSRSSHIGSSELSESASNGDCTVALGSNEGRGYSQFLHATPALHVYTSPVKEQTLLSTSAVGAAVSPPIHVASPYDEIHNQGYSGWTYGVYDSSESQDCAHDVRNEVPNPSLHCQGGYNILNNQQLGDENQTHAEVPPKDVISDASIKFFDGLEAEELKEVEL